MIEIDPNKPPIEMELDDETLKKLVLEKLGDILGRERTLDTLMRLAFDNAYGMGRYNIKFDQNGEKHKLTVYPR